MKLIALFCLLIGFVSAMPLPFSMRQDYPIAHRTKDRRFSVKGLADIQLDLDDYEEQRRTLMAAR